MSDIILHHYDLSPFAEKIRLALGLKGLPSRSVKVEPMPPRPLLDALAGGYRFIPVLQIGADVYCDTEVIFRALERVKPEPTLYPTGEGLVKALSFWWDRASWKPAIGVLVDYIGDRFPAPWATNRRAADFDPWFLIFSGWRTARSPEQWPAIGNLGLQKQIRVIA